MPRKQSLFTHYPDVMTSQRIGFVGEMTKGHRRRLVSHHGTKGAVREKWMGALLHVKCSTQLPICRVLYCGKSKPNRGIFYPW